MIPIRDATPADIPLLAPIEASGDALFVAVGHPEFVGAATISDGYAARAIDEGRIRVAEVVGWLLISRLDGEPFLSQASVAPDNGRQGFGTALLLDCIERARTRWRAVAAPRHPGRCGMERAPGMPATVSGSCLPSR